MEKTSALRADLSTFDNRWYQPGGVLRRLLWLVAGRVFINTYLPIPMALKRAILRFFGAKIAANVVIKPKVNIKYPWFLSVGRNTWIGECVWIDSLALVQIGPDCCLSQGSMLLTGNHNYKSPAFNLIVRPIELAEGVWIGARAVVCPGVRCGPHAVLTVGSIATQALDSFGIYAGNPAIFVRKRILSLENQPHNGSL